MKERKKSFNLSYYNLHTTDAHIDLFESHKNLEEEKKNKSRTSNDELSFKVMALKIVTRRIGDYFLDCKQTTHIEDDYIRLGRDGECATFAKIKPTRAASASAAARPKRNNV
ncbi:CLUMA_CG005068, isoform A [Clunio marinus]|uniref:CLUMA_CG005068, isoform A n=1 Tax=Clunio marinus TaxID=568069 RepID=A0A1J1HTS4_9DIPT|nr:CLUMA_CG005068, isoform A [Clunio marinus]